MATDTARRVLEEFGRHCAMLPAAARQRSLLATAERERLSALGYVR